MSAIRSMTLLHEPGDTTITWTEDQDEHWVGLIRKKMKQGVRFFIVEPRAYGLLPPRKTELNRAGDAKKKRQVAIDDEDLALFLEEGRGETGPAPDLSKTTVTPTSDPEEAGRSRTVATRAMRGG